MVKGLGFDLSQGYLDGAWDLYDRNGDGQLQADECARFLTVLWEQHANDSQTQNPVAAAYYTEDGVPIGQKMAPPTPATTVTTQQDAAIEANGLERILLLHTGMNTADSMSTDVLCSQPFGVCCWLLVADPKCDPCGFDNVDPRPQHAGEVNPPCWALFRGLYYSPPPSTH